MTHTIGASAQSSTITQPHYLSEFLIYYFVKASGTFKIEGNNYDINDGDIFILNPSEIFCCILDKDVFHERIVLHINETSLNKLWSDNGDVFLPLYKRTKGLGNKISAQDVGQYALDKCFVEAFGFMTDSNLTSKFLSNCRVGEIMAKLCKHYSHTTYDEKFINPLISSVLSYLNEHLTKDIDIPKIAAKFRVDKSYLSHLFKECVGISLWSYVILRRIYFFNNLVRDNNNIEEASRKAGFQNYSNFFRLYKKYMGITPTQFKNKLKEKKTL